VVSKLIPGPDCYRLRYYDSYFAACILDIVGHSLCDDASATSDGVEDLCAAIYLRMCCVPCDVSMLCVYLLVCY